MPWSATWQACRPRLEASPVDRFGQPWTNIVDPCAIGGAQDVETAARANGREPCQRRLYLARSVSRHLKKQSWTASSASARDPRMR